MEKYLNFEIAIQDGDGVIRYIVPCSVEVDEKRGYEFDKAVRNFAQLQLHKQGYETYGMKYWLEGVFLSEYKGDYHYDGSRFDTV